MPSSWSCACIQNPLKPPTANQGNIKVGHLHDARLQVRSGGPNFGPVLRLLLGLQGGQR